ncbi:DEAD-box ATP-dependent RNA helicase 50 [Lathyrus oleraceus]|uniref:DEAD-box ATP-dependent RNA helicase 50 n=1 Tax=Pisum sativum TaxID=3888 RepID=A0A9D4WHI2_PEA|nr:DEAD-box ATP-dependent RNA helicase 50 [Pisum sativum]KAI5402251.1 DEAD-box ATP-dependent RNA helicase 50 [Pisum sativum]
MEAVCGKTLLFGIGVNLRIGVGFRTKPTHSLFFVSNSTSDSSTTDSKPQSRFEKLNSNKNKLSALILRSKEKIRRRKQAEQDDNSATATPTRRRFGPHPKGWGDTRVKALPLPLEDTNFFSLKSFKDIGCADFVIQSLHNLSLTRPSHIQAISFAPVIAGKSCIIADQSGSGKTLAYLVPIIQRLRQQELEGRHKSSSQAPTVLILAPTAELASQVLHNCRSISKSGVPFKSMVVTGGFAQKTQLESLNQGVDVLVATPGRFLFLMNEGFLQLTNLTCAVLDEVDILFGDDDFEKALQCLISSSPVDTQYLFVTATLPKTVYSKLVEVFPDCEMVMGPSMHRISSRLEEIIVDCSGEGVQEKTLDTAFLNKKAALLKLAEGNRVPRTIVFCNKIETCRKVENALNRFDRKGTRMQVLPFHAAMTQESRLASMKEFTRPPSKELSQFMVCTDRASRGIDFSGVDHVILFDYPRDPSEYVRRVGRTARGARGQGKAFIFVVGKQVSLARKITERNRKGHPLHDVPSAYES